jgi:hypothetical protein
MTLLDREACSAYLLYAHGGRRTGIPGVGSVKVEMRTAPYSLQDHDGSGGVSCIEYGGEHHEKPESGSWILSISPGAGHLHLHVVAISPGAGHLLLHVVAISPGAGHLHLHVVVCAVIPPWFTHI